MGLLDAFKQYISDIGGSLNPEIGGLLAQTGETIKRNARQRDTVMKGLLADPSNRDLQRQAVAQGLDMASIAPIGMTVWHGSPHKFTKFDMSKIGTGEGAQAYGHGLYVAEHPSVANEYAAKLGNPEVLFNGKRADQLNVSQAAQRMAQWIESRARAMQYGSQGQTARQDFSRLPDAIQKELGGRVDVFDGGNLYKTDIPDEAVARFLDWDKPLSQQAPEVRDALAAIKAKQAESLGVARFANPAKALEYKLATKPLPDDMSGESIYRFLGNNHQDATELLRQQGIPGIRYLDGGSRSAGQGSSNFVLFDDQLPRIMEINGQATGTAPWKPGEWRGLLSP